MESTGNEHSQEKTESQTSNICDSSASYQLVPNTPTQKSSCKKVKTPRYLQNASIKLLTHPVDKNIAWSFLLSVIFAAISVLTGFPTVIALMWFLGIALGLRIFFAGCCGYRRSARIGDVEEQRQNRRSSWLGPENFVKPPEALWLHDSSFNLHIAHCLFFLDPGLTSSKLRDMVRMRVLNKTTEYGERAFPRFMQKVVPVCSGYCWVDDEEFSLDNHIYDEQKEILSTKDLEEHINDLMNQPLPLSRPLWEIRLIKDFGRCKDTVLIVRIHQAVSDAITLIVILGNYLSDNQQLLRLKSRFGSATFFLNLFRALFVAPLTFLGWLMFKPRDYNFFNRRHKPQNRVVAWSQNIRFSKVLRIKQVMRCSFNDVFVSAVSGAVRAYFNKSGVRNPPNVTLSIPVDLRHETSNATAIPTMGCRFSQVHVRLPSNTEGAIPRLWDVRRRMEELKTSPDTVVMYGAIYCLLPILPEVIAQWIIKTVLRKATVVLANVPGPEEILTLGSKRLRKITFWMSPTPEIPVVFSVISYAGTIQLSVSADKMVVAQPQLLVNEF
ncbi:putative diacylglycerol O-acyltransferase Rv2484c/MT2557, partial [Stegodyphus mimosarum]